jgi:hypothetical protein
MWEAERVGPDEEFEMVSEILAVEADTGVARVTVVYEEAEQKERRLHRQQEQTATSGSSAWTRPASASTSRSGRSGRRIRKEPPRPVADAWDNGSVDDVLVVRCGLVPYEEGLALQK